MGTCNFKAEKEIDNISAISKNHFQFHYVIGKGGFGKVWKVEKKKAQNTFYAMKEMSKSRIMTKRSVNSVLNEMKLLKQLRHPQQFNIPHKYEICILRQRKPLFRDGPITRRRSSISYLQISTIYRRINKQVPQQIEFFVANILLGLEYIHNHSILHRDIKPENLVFDSKGFLHTTDFGIARIWNPNNSQETSGTPGYMAPEVMCRQNHGVAVDYFALGVITYECMMGSRPYRGKTRKEIRDHILSKQISIRRQQIPSGWSVEGADFINKLLIRKPQNRLGLNGPMEVKTHCWFNNFNWQQLYDKTMKAPFQIPNTDNFDQKNSNEGWKDEDQDSLQKNLQMLRRNSVQELFNGYYYDDAIAAMNPPLGEGERKSQQLALGKVSQNTVSRNSSRPTGGNQTTLVMR